MDITTFFLAQFWGWLLVILGLIFLLKRKTFLEGLFNLVDDKGFILLSGYLALIFGLFTVILHNVWVFDWRIVITILGWLSLVKGIIRTGFPVITRKFVPVLKNKPVLFRVLLTVMVFLGAWLLRMS